MSGPADRAAAAERLLERSGVPVRGVRATGHEREIAAVTAPPEALARIGELAGEIRSIGFKYVALDLTAAVSSGSRRSTDG